MARGVRCRVEVVPPFLAIHTLRRIAEDSGSGPVIWAVRYQTYVDDYLSSSLSIAEATSEAVVVKEVLSKANLNLQRYISNSP